MTSHAGGSEDPRHGGWDFLAALPLEVVFDILQQIHPVGSLTLSKPDDTGPRVRHDYIEARSSFASLCRVCRWLRPIATRHLYNAVLVRNQTELLCFFRTIAGSPALGRAARSFAWTGILPTSEIGLDGTALRENQMASLAPHFWTSINWASRDDEFDITRLLSAYSPETPQNWKLLAAVLAMMPRLESVFLPQAHVPVEPARASPWPEQKAIWALFMSQPSPPRFLQELNTITIEPHCNNGNRWLTGKTAMAVVANSPIRRIELKGHFNFQILMYDAKKFWNVDGGSKNVKELLLFSAYIPTEEMKTITTVFPNLVSFEAEHVTSDFRKFYNSNVDVSNGLLRVSRTLENLSLTTAPGENWPRSDQTPMLSSLRQMAVLRVLTIESIWLFGRREPFAVELSDILPSSLVRFHLIDFWGMLDADTFYPQPHDTWSLVKFYNQAFSRLQASCLARFPNLKEVEFSLRSQDSPTNIDSDDVQDQPGEVQTFLKGLDTLFRTVGVRFSVLAPETQSTRLRASWANMDRASEQFI